MKVILLKDVPNLGKANEIVDVADGYAKNYLIRKQLATGVNSSTLKIRENDLINLEKAYLNKLDEIKELKKSLESKPLEFVVAMSNGQVDSFINNKAILEKLNKTKKIINKYMFIKENKLGLGTHQVVLKLHKEVEVNLQIIVSRK